MYVITVIPISRGIGKETLSYFTSSEVELGSMVKVPLRKKTVEALVIKIEDARNMKALLRSADFALRKVDKLVSKPFLSEAFMKTVQEVAHFHAATIGATLKVMLPKKHAMSHIVQKEVVIVPTKEQQRVAKKRTDKPVLLPSSLVDIPETVSSIVIQAENNPAYKGISRPFIDWRMAIETYAKHIGAKITKKNLPLNPKVKKVSEKHVKEEDRPFTSIGKDLGEFLHNGAHCDTSHIFILGTRTGHSGTVLCQDCGETVKCVRCDSPLTLHLKATKEEYNNLLCHHCGFKTTALTACKKCGGWRLKSFGLGVEKIEEDMKSFLKKHKIKAYVQRIDSTLKLTPKKIREFIATHFEKDRAILIGTELVLPYFMEHAAKGEKNDASYIASLDTLLSLPDFSINEKIWRLCCLLDASTEEKVVIQTRNPDHPLLVAWKDNDEKEFWEKELEERKAFNYPPHGVFIKITVKGRKEKAAIEMKKVETLLKEWKPMVFPAFIKSVNNQSILHCLITLPKDEWPNEELLALILSLPPSVTIEVNPRSLL